MTDRTCQRGVEISFVAAFQTTECMVRITVAFAEHVRWQLIVFDEHSQKANPTPHETRRFTYREHFCDLQTEAIVHGNCNLLLRSQVALRGLNRRVSQQKLDLLQIPATLPAELRAGTP